LLALALAAGCSDKDGNGNGDGSVTDDGNGSDGSNGSDTKKDGGNGGPDIPICDEEELGASPVSNLLLVVDKSDSMNDPTSAGGRAKMADLREAVNFLLDEFEGKIRFGWMAFPYRDDGAPGVVSVDIANDSAPRIRELVEATIAWGKTPTGESLENANSYSGLKDEERANYVVLVTDGMPTCPNGNGLPNDQDNALALAAVQALQANQIDTYVIGLGEDINSSNPQLLQDMAAAGGTGQYHPANSLDDLKAAFEEIGKAVFECSMNLGVVPEEPDWIWVYFDGVPISRDRNHQNGFDYDAAENKIDFYGPACDRLLNGEVSSVDVKMGCKPPD
jgi:Mg-chelatase subunit ChlD